MSNLNVTASLISFYLAMKFKKGFTLFGAINPLRNELGRLHFKSRQNKQSYVLHNYRAMFALKIKKYKRFLKKTLKLFKAFFKNTLYINYIKNNSLNFYNTYIYQKNRVSKKFKNFVKLFYISIFYKIFITFNKIKLKSKAYFNTLLNNSFDILSYISRYIKYKHKSPVRLVTFNLFICKNLFNYEYLKRYW